MSDTATELDIAYRTIEGYVGAGDPPLDLTLAQLLQEMEEYMDWDDWQETRKLSLWAMDNAFERYKRVWTKLMANDETN